MCTFVYSEDLFVLSVSRNSKTGMLFLELTENPYPPYLYFGTFAPLAIFFGQKKGKRTLEKSEFNSLLELFANASTLYTYNKKVKKIKEARHD